MKRAAILGAAGRDFHNFRLSSAVITILKSSPLVPVNEKFAHLLDAAADGEVIVSGRDNQVRPDNATFRTHLVVMNQATARRASTIPTPSSKFTPAVARTCVSRMFGSAIGVSVLSSARTIAISRAS